MTSRIKPMTVRNKIQRTIILAVSLFLSLPGLSQAWYDNTHLAIAKAAGYPQWYNAAGPDIAKIKAGDKEDRNHYSNNPPDTVITPQMILDQVARYDDKAMKKGIFTGPLSPLSETTDPPRQRGNTLSIISPIVFITLATYPCRSIIPSTIRSTGGTIPPWMEL